MGTEVIAVFWVVGLSCLFGLATTAIRLRLSAPGWLGVYALVLVVDVAGWLLGWSAIVYLSAGMWVGLILLPVYLTVLGHRRVLQQRYAAAQRLTRFVSWLHPLDGYPHEPQLIHALELAQRGEVAAATEILQRFENVQSPIGMMAALTLYRITHRWQDVLAWQDAHPRQLERNAAWMPAVLRAYGETGDVGGLVEFYDRHRRRIEKLAPASSRDLCRLMLFAFGGRPETVDRLLAGTVADMPSLTQRFWRATAKLSQGDAETARREFEELRRAADPMLQQAIDRRLSQLAAVRPPLDQRAQDIVAEAERDHGHEETFAPRRSFFSRRARATQLLIVLNVLMFALEMLRGGSTRPEVLYHLGALYPPSVIAGQWWRLITATFLHFGPFHLAMNMLALGFFGPFVEAALGRRRFVAVYLVAGVGSAATVLAFSLITGSTPMMVGGSGCVMGLIGASSALMLRGWMRHHARPARRRLVTMLLMVGLQVVFDSLVPHVSMTAHLAGATIGFAATLLLRDRLRGNT